MSFKGFAKSHQRRLFIGGVCVAICAICIIVTAIVVVSINSIRQEYSVKAVNRDQQVQQLSEQVGEIKKKLDTIPEQTAEKAVEKVKPLVKEDEKK